MSFDFDSTIYTFIAILPADDFKPASIDSQSKGTLTSENGQALIDFKNSTVSIVV